MESLTLLYLQEFNGEGMNGCCAVKGYRGQVLKLFKSLTCLDGQRINLPTCLDMQELGLITGTDDGDLEYDMQKEGFYSEQIFETQQLNKVQIG